MLRATPRQKQLIFALVANRLAKLLSTRTVFVQTPAASLRRVSRFHDRSLNILQRVLGPFRTPTLQSATSRPRYIDTQSLSQLTFINY